MTAAEVKYALLGPVDVVVHGRRVDLGGRVQRALLGALLLRANEPVPTERLVDAVWGDRPPVTAAHAVSVYLSKLRKQLGAEVIGRTSAGYVLRVAPGTLDLERFEMLLATARQELAAGDAAPACQLLDEALALWRGPPLAGLRLEDFAQVSIARLEELRLAAIKTRVEAKLQLGEHQEVIPELDALTREHWDDERLCGLLMLALYRAGRHGDALASYQLMRVRLSEELGIEPSQSLHELERKILEQHPSLELEPQNGEVVRSVVVVPHRLDHLEELAALAEPFGQSKNPHEVIFAWLEPPGPPDAVSRALGEASAVLARLRDGLVERGARARVAAFTTTDRAEDTLRLARRSEVDLLVLEPDASEVERGPFDPALAHVLAVAPCDVALWFRRGERPAQSSNGAIVVPFGALEHDWAALELGAWLAGTTRTSLVLLGAAGDAGGDRRDASRMLADAGLLIQRVSGVVAKPRLMESGRKGLLEAVSDAGLVLAGLSERWPREGLGTTRLELARAAAAPAMFLRRGKRPSGLSPPESLTLFRWSVTAAR